MTEIWAFVETVAIELEVVRHPPALILSSQPYSPPTLLFRVLLPVFPVDLTSVVLAMLVKTMLPLKLYPYPYRWPHSRYFPLPSLLTAFLNVFSGSPCSLCPYRNSSCRSPILPGSGSMFDCHPSASFLLMVLNPSPGVSFP